MRRRERPAIMAELGRLQMLAALSAAVAIGAAAFGAHGVATPKAAEWLRTGGEYQLAHAIALLVLAHRPGLVRPAMLLLAGSLIFAVTLYAMALGAPRWLGAVTPVGGVLMIAGWLWAAWRFAQAAS
jgi:uncharacterized membrane protein YgdD (TMEM256/DUF423 family)